MPMPLTDDHKLLLAALEDALEVLGASDALLVLKVRSWLRMAVVTWSCVHPADATAGLSRG